MKKFTFRNWASYGGVDADVVGVTLETIEVRDGSIKPAAVVDAARPEESQIHPCFEWNDPIAAEEWRKQQARNLIRSVRVQYIDDSGAEATNPGFCHVKAISAKVEKIQPERSGYVSTARLLDDDDLYERAMRELQGRLIAAARSVNELKDLASTSERRDTLAALNIIAASLATASTALQHLH